MTKYLLIPALAVGYTALADPTPDASVSAALTTLTDTWALIKTALLAIGTFLVAYAFFKRVRRA